jgi:O-phosphoseryl-tRNA(Cys) synthetase
LKRFKQIERDRKQFDKENIHSNVENISNLTKSQAIKVQESVVEEEEEVELDSEIDVASLKVSELRLHLKERGLDQFGLKKDLQKRLQSGRY